jgi:hypothetical protein
MAMIGMCAPAAFSQERMALVASSPIHFWHLYIHGDEIELASLDSGKRLAAIADNRVCAGPLKLKNNAPG